MFAELERGDVGRCGVSYPTGGYTEIPVPPEPGGSLYKHNQVDCMAFSVNTQKSYVSN